MCRRRGRRRSPWGDHRESRLTRPVSLRQSAARRSAPARRRLWTARPNLARTAAEPRRRRQTSGREVRSRVVTRRQVEAAEGEPPADAWPEPAPGEATQSPGQAATKAAGAGRTAIQILPRPKGQAQCGSSSAPEPGRAPSSGAGPWGERSASTAGSRRPPTGRWRGQWRHGAAVEAVPVWCDPLRRYPRVYLRRTTSANRVRPGAGYPCSGSYRTSKTFWTETRSPVVSRTGTCRTSAVVTYAGSRTAFAGSA